MIGRASIDEPVFLTRLCRLYERCTGNVHTKSKYEAEVNLAVVGELGCEAWGNGKFVHKYIVRGNLAHIYGGNGCTYWNIWKFTVYRTQCNSLAQADRGQ